jgi:hypothetical protein
VKVSKSNLYGAALVFRLTDVSHSPIEWLTIPTTFVGFMCMTIPLHDVEGTIQHSRRVTLKDQTRETE